MFSASIAMIFVLRKRSIGGKWKLSLLVGGTALIAHLFDYFVTLSVSPDLSLEANPIWRTVIERMGLDFAIWYGLTGKIILAILSFECFAYYLIQRETLLPKKTDGFVSFFRNFGKHNGSQKRPSLENMINFFNFLFAFIGHFCFYIAFLNSRVNSDAYLLLPSMPVMLFVYLVVLTFAYLFGNYILFKRKLDDSGEQKMKAEKTFNKSSISKLTSCGIAFIFLFSVSGCFLQKGYDAEADLMATILFPAEADEKTGAHKLMDVYEVRGHLTNESILHETSWGAAYVPHLVLDVEETIKVEPKGKGKTSAVSTQIDYLKITCRQVSEDYHGIYEMGETTAGAIDKKVSVIGAVYRCGDNWYICEKDETEIYCDIDGKAAYDSTHIQLINLKIHEIGKPK